MMLEVSVKKALPSFNLDLSFEVRTGELKVLIGPSGAGKSTIIRMIAGLEKPDEGLIEYHGEKWVDTARGIFVRPQKRIVGYVFQDYRLFPHLTVYENAAFAAQDKGRVEDLLRLFGIWGLKDSMPHKISGGERQRCAICQNLARKPRVLLLDEPFSALDAENRRKLRRELKALKREMPVPILHVTHDLGEAMFLGDQVVPIVRGAIAPEWLERQLAETRAEEAESLFGQSSSYPFQSEEPEGRSLGVE